MTNGVHFDDFQTGQVYTTLRKTITEADTANFCSVCGFWEPLFIDREYVENESQFGKPIVPGALTFSLSEGLTILTGILTRTGMALLGVEMKVLKPTHIGDTIRVEIKVLEKRETKKPDRGIVAFRHRTLNQEDVPVLEYIVRRMIRRKWDKTIE
jgi:acyl dehydratase